MSHDRDQLIRERAYAIWEAAGRPSDCDQDHWTQAMREVDDIGKAEDDAPKKRAAPVRSKPKRARDAAAPLADAPVKRGRSWTTTGAAARDSETTPPAVRPRGKAK